MSYFWEESHVKSNIITHPLWHPPFQVVTFGCCRTSWNSEPGAWMLTPWWFEWPVVLSIRFLHGLLHQPGICLFQFALKTIQKYGLHRLKMVNCPQHHVCWDPTRWPQESTWSANGSTSARHNTGLWIMQTPVGVWYSELRDVTTTPKNGQTSHASCFLAGYDNDIPPTS